MKKPKLIFTLLISLLTQLSFLDLSVAASWRQTQTDAIRRSLGEIRADDSHFSIWIKRGEEKVEINANRLFTPASISKIPTALAFLDSFSQQKTLKTWIYGDGIIKNGVLHGDLYLKGGGDPSLVSENLWLMVRELKRTGLIAVQGKVYVDETYFDDDYYSDGRQKRRVDRAYDAPISGLSFNWNSLNIYVRPGQRPGDSVKVFTEPEIPSLKIVNSAKTVTGSRTQLHVERKERADGSMVVHVSGTQGISAPEKDFYKSVVDAAQWAGEVFLHYLNHEGIDAKSFAGKKQTPRTAQQLVEYEGWEISRIVAALSKFSNNLVAEILTKHIGKKDGVPATLEDGLNKIHSYLAGKGWAEADYNFISPSGFTHKNKIRADRLGELLVQARQQFQLAPEFLSSLPISGVDGTLEKRMTKAMAGKVRAKTGYMGGVVSLAGYLESPLGEDPITFVFMYNGPPKHDWDVRDLFDKILWQVYQGTK